MIRRLFAALLGIVLLSGCTGVITMLGAEEPTQVRDELAALPGVVKAETEANNSGWTLTLGLDPGLDAGGQAQVIEQVYQVLDASDRKSDLGAVNLELGPQRTIRIDQNQRFDTTNGMLEYLAQLPNHHLLYGAQRASAEVAARLPSFADLSSELAALTAIELPAGPPLSLTLTDPAAQFGQPGDFMVIADLPISPDDQQFFDASIEVLAASAAVGASYSFSSTQDPHLRFLTVEQEPDLFEQVLALAKSDPRDVKVEAAYTTSGSTLQNYASETA